MLPLPAFTATVTAKGQITLRKELLRHLGIGPGDKLVVDKRPDGSLEMRAAKSGKPISRLFGRLHDPSIKPLTIEEMNEVIADSWAGGRGPYP